MPIWTNDKAPTFREDAVGTESGWENPVTGELVVAIRELSDKAGPADVNAVHFAAAVLAQGDNLAVKVRFNERVNATAGVSILVTSTGAVNPIQLFAAQQLGVQEVLFNLQADLVTPVVVPAEAAVLSVGLQSIVVVLPTSFICDALNTRPYSHLAISAAALTHTGTRTVV